MLQNPQWDFHSLVGLRDWLAKQPADEPYDWSSCERCVVGKYLAGHGELTSLYGSWIRDTPGASRAVPKCFSDYTGFGGRQPMTLGNALKELDAYMAENP
jgi:hypothetical protein